MSARIKLEQCPECSAPGANCMRCEGEGLVEVGRELPAPPSRPRPNRRPSERLAVAASILFPFRRRTRRKWLLPPEIN